jgi:hypothetical protein
MAVRRSSVLWTVVAGGALLLCILAFRGELAANRIDGAGPATSLAAPEVERGATGDSPNATLAQPDGRPSAMPAVRTVQPRRAPAACSLVARADLPAGTPVESVMVVLRQGSQVLARAELDEALEARFDGVPPGRYSAELDCDVQQLGLVKSLWPPTAWWKRGIELQRGEERAVSLCLQRGASLRGTLFDASGVPIAMAYIQLHPVDLPFGLDTPGMLTDEVGGFAFEGLAPGDHRVVASWTHSGRARTEALPTPLDVTLEPGETRWLSLQSSAHPRSISGRLVDREGKPLAGEYVDCELFDADAPLTGAESVGESSSSLKPVHWSRRLARVSTDEGGRFRMDGLPPVPVVVRAASVGPRVRGFTRSTPHYATQLSEPLDLRLEDAHVELGDWTLSAREAE